MVLSEKETKLLDFIKESKEKVTIAIIEEKLGKSYTGALGKLLNGDLIEGRKDKSLTIPSGLYSTKLVKYYVIKEVKIDE